MGKKGILLANIGTPDRPEPKEVRRYLKAFLGDPRVIDKPRWQWLPILHGIILNTRPKKSAELYRSIWQDEGSPLLIHTKAQTAGLQEIMPEAVVKYGMAYSEPTISQSLKAFEKEGVEEITIVPMYPQYSTSTTASIYDAVFKHYLKTENIPALNFIKDFATHPGYINLLRRQIEAGVATYKPDLLLLSYHGIPVSYVKKGDPYEEQCEATTQAVFADWECGVPYKKVYQSKFGPDPWLTLALDQTLKDLPSQGVKNILVITPGFVADCVETIEEIEVENYGYFMESGGVEFNYIHPFNSDSDFIEVLKEIVK